MILIDYTNIEDQPLKNMMEVLDNLSIEVAPEFTLNTDIPVCVVSVGNRIVGKGTGRSKTVNKYLLSFSIGLVHENVTGLIDDASELRNLLDAAEDSFNAVNMSFFDIQSSPSQLVRNDKTYNVQNFTVQYTVI